jgi:hypothetical protein
LYTEKNVILEMEFTEWQTRQSHLQQRHQFCLFV